MPYQLVDGTTVSYPGVAIETTYDYNLVYTPNGCSAYGLSVQVIYTNITDISIQLQCSNDGVNFSDVPNGDADDTSDGNVLFDLGTPAYKILRVILTPNATTADFVVIFNAINLS